MSIKKTFELLRADRPDKLGYIIPSIVIEEIPRRAKPPIPIFFEFNCKRPIGKIKSLRYDQETKQLVAECIFFKKIPKNLEKLKLAATGRCKAKMIDMRKQTEVLSEFVLISASLTKNKA